MALTTFYWARFQALGDAGEILPGAVLEFFEAGTATPLPVYADVDGNTSLGVTVTADASGVFAELFMLPQAYDINLYDQNGVLINSVVDWFPPQAASSANLDVTAIAGITFAAGEGAYISDGSAGLNAGQAYKWDADLEYASGTPQVYFAVQAVTAGESGLFREAGIMTGLSGLTPGARYYISGTSGAISVTPGTHRRMIGQAKSTTELFVTTNPPFFGEIQPALDARLKSIFNGRLSLTTGVPVTTADVTAAPTLFLALYQGNQFALYTGTKWVVVTLAQLSIAAPTGANQVADVFLDYNDGSPVLALTNWTDDTTRATALTTQDGILVKTGDTQQRYVGTIRTVTASQLNDSEALRHVWNYYNRVDRFGRVLETTNSWNYTTATYRQARATATNQLDFVCGVAEDAMDALLTAAFSNDNAAVWANVSIGLDSTTTPATGVTMDRTRTAGANTPVIVKATLKFIPPVGRHTLVWLEYSDAGVGTTSWYGDNNEPTLFQSGISSVWRA